jgi:hypothetical protein
MQTTPSAHRETAGAELEDALPTSNAPGRPTLCTDATIHDLLTVIKAYGVSDSAAATRLGLAASTVSRWKARRPDLQLQCAAARETFRISQLELILEARTRDGRSDWRAAAWLLQHVFPEDYARRPERPRAALESAANVVPSEDDQPIDPWPIEAEPAPPAVAPASDAAFEPRASWTARPDATPLPQTPTEAFVPEPADPAVPAGIALSSLHLPHTPLQNLRNPPLFTTIVPPSVSLAIPDPSHYPLSDLSAPLI